LVPARPRADPPDDRGLLRARHPGAGLPDALPNGSRSPARDARPGAGRRPRARDRGVTRSARLYRGVSLAAASPRDAWLLARMLAWRPALPLLKGRLALPKLAQLMWQAPAAPARAGRADRVADFVPRLYRLRGDGICLERSLLAYRFLSEAGADPRLVVGVRP